MPDEYQTSSPPFSITSPIAPGPTRRCLSPHPPASPFRSAWRRSHRLHTNVGPQRQRSGLPQPLRTRARSRTPAPCPRPQRLPQARCRLCGVTPKHWPRRAAGTETGTVYPKQQDRSRSSPGDTLTCAQQALGTHICRYRRVCAAWGACATAVCVCPSVSECVCV